MLAINQNQRSNNIDSDERLHIGIISNIKDYIIAIINDVIKDKLDKLLFQLKCME